VATITNNDLPRKPSHTTKECDNMLREATAYIAEDSVEQAEIMIKTFDKVAEMLETLPELGTKYKYGIRKIGLGKFRRYNVYYRETETEIEILGILHTSRGVEFADIYNPQ